MNAEEFRRFGHELIDWVARYRDGLEQRPVMSQVEPGAVKDRFPKAPPAKGGGLPDALERLERDILPGITHWNHPSFFAYFPSNTSFASILGDLVASGLGVQGMSWQTSPAATEVEEVTMNWLRQMVGLSDAWTGVIHDTASTATLCALLCARERVSEFSQNTGGLQSVPAPLVVYTSTEAHSSVEKGALLAGFGRNHLRCIDTDAEHAMVADKLEDAIRDDLRAGRKPCAIVATVGTTSTTAVDPVRDIARIATAHGLWLHVDAAMAGTAMVLPECREYWAGIEDADSLVFNPHKWMGVGFDLSAYFVRDVEHLVAVMSTHPSYLKTVQDGTVRNYRDWHIQLGRRFRALKLWFFLADVGVSGLQERIRRDLDNARWLRDQVLANPKWELMAPVHFQTVCIRHVPDALADDDPAIDRHNLELAHRINSSGRAYVTPALLNGRQMIRVSVGAEATERHHVAAMWELLGSAGVAGDSQVHARRKLSTKIRS
ncbi:MAG: pyridoxal phosphate-dependent decarboxylase family protein [Gammaproteobacteria bacterium]